MKLKKSKKGSGLIVVIMMFAFLSIVGMAFISMSLSSYKLRAAKSNAKTGLYGAESGIDEAYGIIGNKVDESIKKGNDEVNTFMDKLSSDLNYIKKEINDPKNKEQYKSLQQDRVNQIIDNIIDKIEKENNYRYLNNIKSCIKSKIFKSQDNTLKDIKLYVDDEEVSKCQNNIFKDKYIENILKENKDKENIDDDIVPILKEISNCSFEINKDKPKIDAKIVIGKDKYSNLIEDIDDNLLSKLKEDKKIPIRIESEFKYKGTTKKVKADYTINIPPYNKSYYVKDDTEIVHENPVFAKAISIDGDMVINGETNINGDIYVKGNEALNNSNIDKNNLDKNDKEKNKTNGDSGIIINNKSDFKGNVVTTKDFKIKGANIECSVKGNIFANNVLLDSDAKSSKLIVGEVKKDEDKDKSQNEKKNQKDIKKEQYNVYTQDDLEINALNSTTVINGAYYGLNNGDKSTNAGSSSSININAVEGGEVKCILDIKGRGSIIMGTSYAEFYKDEDKNKEHPYQTGESVSIKGNYRAYSLPSNTSPLNKYIFNYYSPNSDGKDENNNVIVGLVSKDGSSKELNVFDKSEYFKDIVSTGYDIFNWDGINVNGAECIHVGAIFNKDEKNVKVSASNEKFIIDHLEEVSRRIKEFNTQVYNMGEESNEIDLLDKTKKSVATQLNKVSDYTISNGDDMVVLKNENSIVVSKNSDKDDIAVLKSKNSDNRDEIKIDGKNALIIINGDLTVKSKLNFTGALIVTGNLTIENGGSLNITYNEGVIKSLIGNNYEKLKDVFKNNSEGVYKILNKSTINTDGHSDIVLNKLIQMKNWKIIK